MNALRRLLRAALAAMTLAAAVAHAHSASDAYLVLDAVPSGTGTVIHGQWDIALRDLDFVLQLDDDGDGNITWKELRAHQDAIARYAYASLSFAADGRACTVTPVRQLVADHADGSYAALFFDVHCAMATAPVLDYGLFFSLDPSHRGILTMHGAGGVATALLAPDHRRVPLPR